jgi:hypothetical protein
LFDCYKNQLKSLKIYISPVKQTFLHGKWSYERDSYVNYTGSPSPAFYDFHTFPSAFAVYFMHSHIKWVLFVTQILKFR